MCLCGGEALASGLVVDVRSDKNQYVLGEPVKLTASVRNETGQTIRVPSVTLMDQFFMHFMYFEVTSPTGALRRLKHVAIFQELILGPHYAGAPLAPGDSIQVFLYPARTNVAVDANGMASGERISSSETFPVTGRYKLRVVYQVWPDLDVLFPGKWRSNEVELIMRKPDSEQREILDALWQGMPAGEGGIDWSRRDLKRLKAVIDKYPHDDLTLHVRFALARGLEWEDRYDDAITILRALNTSHPEFRHEEMQLWLGRVYIGSGAREEGADMLFSAMGKEPALWTNPAFVEAVTVIGIRDFSVKARWEEQESRLGAKPMTKEQFLSTFASQ